MNIQIEDLSFNARYAMELCGCSIEDASMIASILADDVFHSTLDWQTEEELRRGCFEAQQILEENRADYEAYFAAGRLRYAELVRAQEEAEAAEHEAQARGTAGVSSQEAEVAHREAEIAQGEAAVTHREVAVARCETGITHRKAVVAQREIVVAQREIAVARREAEAAL